MAPPSRLTHKQKWIICQFKADNPSMSQVALVAHFNTKWGKTMSASTMSTILKNKMKWVVPESNIPAEASLPAGPEFGIVRIVPENSSRSESMISPEPKSKPSGSNSSMPSILTQNANLSSLNRRRKEFATELAATKKMLEKYDYSNTVPLMLNHDSICEDCRDANTSPHVCQKLHWWVFRMNK